MRHRTPFLKIACVALPVCCALLIGFALARKRKTQTTPKMTVAVNSAVPLNIKPLSDQTSNALSVKAYKILKFASVGGITLSPNGEILAVATGDKVRCLNMENMKLQRTFNTVASSVAFSSDGKTLFSLSTSNCDDASCSRLITWNIQCGKLQHRSKVLYDVQEIAGVLPDDKILFFRGGHYPELSLWKTTTTKRLARVELESTNRAWAFCPRKNLVARSAFPSSIALFNLTTGAKVSALNEKSFSFNEGIVAARCSPDETKIATVGTDSVNVFIRLWSIETGELLRTFPSYQDFHLSPVRPAFSQNGKRLYVVSGNSIRVLNVQTGKLECLLTGHQNAINGMVPMKDNHTLISSSQGGTVQFWRIP